MNEIKHLSKWTPFYKGMERVEKIPRELELTYFSTIKGYGGTQESITIEDMAYYINNLPQPDIYPPKMTKDQYAQYKVNLPAVKTGRYNGTGKKEVDRVYLGDYIFFDLDVKKDNENKHLMRAGGSSSRVLQLLQEYAVIAYRSPSQVGFSGVLYVPHISTYPPAAHKVITKKIYHELEELIFRASGIKIVLDPAQSPAVQARFLAPAYEIPVQVNKKPYAFLCTADEVKQYNENKTPVFVREGGCRVGSIEERYNNDNPDIHSHLRAAGFDPTSTRRGGYKHPATSSPDSGNVSTCESFFWCSSESYLASTMYSGSTGKKLFPFHLALIASCKSYRDFCKWLETEKGYKLKADDINRSIETALMLSKRARRDKEIYSLCQPLLSLSVQERLRFLHDSDIPEKEKYRYRDYLRLKNLRIEYDETLTVKGRLSDVSPALFDLADKHRKIVIAADTGLGKTYAMLERFQQCRPDKRLLFIAPLAMIVKQAGTQYDKVALFGDDVKITIWDAAIRADVVIATQEKAKELLSRGYKFDYIVLDEIHSFIVGNDYKPDVISEVMQNVEKRGVPIIGLTGTPLKQFRDVGFKIVKVENENQKTQDIIMRLDNQSSIDIILDHQSSVKGKALYRVQSRNEIELLKDHFLKNGYAEDEVEVYYSSNEVRMSDRYESVANKEEFPDRAKIVLTTSFLEEGVNIKNMGFTDVVYIDGDYSGIDLSLKQLINRFRSTDVGRKHYWYAKHRTDQRVKTYSENIEDDYEYLKNVVPNKDDFNRATFLSLASVDKYIYDNGEVNNLALVNYHVKKYHEILNTTERIQFLNENYNINVILDEDYSHVTGDTDEIKKSSDKNKIRITNLYLNKLPEVGNTVMSYTLDKELKEELIVYYSADPLEVSDIDFIIKNIKIFETVIKRHMEISEYDEEPSLYILNKDGLVSVNSPKWAHRKSLLDNISLIREPNNREDRRYRKKTIETIIELEKIEDPKKSDLVRILKNNRFFITGRSHYEKVVNLIEYFTDFTYDSKKTRFTFEPKEDRDIESWKRNRFNSKSQNSLINESKQLELYGNDIQA